jgi:hypothetical protein
MVGWKLVRQESGSMVYAQSQTPAESVEKKRARDFHGNVEQ